MKAASHAWCLVKDVMQRNRSGSHQKQATFIICNFRPDFFMSNTAALHRIAANRICAHFLVIT